MISGLHHYALEVPDLEVAEGFLQDFGLETGEKDGSLVAVCPGRDQEQVRLLQAPVKRGSWIEWFSGIDQIDDCWVAGDWDVPPHLWGAPPPESFLANHEPEEQS